jgi:hypothetical protein
MRNFVESIAYIANLVALLLTAFAFLGLLGLLTGGAGLADITMVLALAIVPHCLVTCLYRLIPSYNLPQIAVKPGSTGG